MTAQIKWAAAVIVLLCAAVIVHADQLLWDNCPGGVASIQNPNYAMSSERNTALWESTWVVDDVDFAQLPDIEPDDVSLTRVSWYGARDASYTYSTVDVILLDSQFNTLFEMSDLPYETVDYPVHLNSGLQLYEGTVDLAGQNPASATPIELPEHFYVGVRLVGDGYFQGTNRAVAFSIDTLRGRTEGYTLAALFGAPDWKPASQVWYGPPTDYKFEFGLRVFGDVIPEPAAMALLLCGSVLLVKRRTN